MSNSMERASQKPFLKLLPHIIIPLLAALLFLALAICNLDASIWFDESYSAYLTRGSFAEIWNLTALDVHPPFFYFCLKIWAELFGYTDVSMRFMSVFFAVIAIILSFHLFRRWFGTKNSAVMTFALALSPMLIRYGEEMRMYTLVFLIVVAATYTLDLLIETNKKRYYILYAVLLALGMWTHYFTILAWLAHLIYYWWTTKKILWRTYLGAILLFSPWMPALLVQIGAVQAGFWIGEISGTTIPDFFANILLFLEADAVRSWFFVIFCAVFVLAGWLFWRYRTAFINSKFKLLLCLTFLPPLLLLIISLPPLSPMFVDRYLLYSTAFLWAILGLAISVGFQKAVSKHPLKFFCLTKSKNSFVCRLFIPLCLAGCLLFCAHSGFLNVKNRQPAGYVKDIILAVQAVSDTGEPLVAGNEWIYYDGCMYSSVDAPVYGVDEWIDYRYGSLEPIRNLRYNLIDNFAEFVAATEKFWYIVEVVDGDTDPATVEVSIDDIKLPAENLQIISTVSTPHHVALELAKS